MSLERARELLVRFRRAVETFEPNTTSSRWTLSPELGRELLESMLLARHLDVAAHELRAAGHGQYTICSSGHEANVVFGRLTGPSDPAILHYRSAATQIERARHAPGIDVVRDIALSLVASSDEPLCSGRHKVFGNKALGIVPQTSTIASHLPRAVGMAYALGLGLDPSAPLDAMVLVSFGDASVNHSTLLGALNAVSFTLHQNLKLPLLLVCEDNGLGVSVRTPPGWVETRLQALPHIRYFASHGHDLQATYGTAEAAVQHCRQTRHAAVLQLRCERLLGHAGSDVDSAYRSPAEIADALARDPVTNAALSLLAGGAIERAELIELDRTLAERVRQQTDYACTRPKLATRVAVMGTIAEPVENGFSPLVQDAPSDRSLTLAQGINQSLGELLEAYPEALLFGEDVAKKGGVYGVTKGLFAKFGARRVFNTLLDEQTILGLGLGMATLGLVPIPEIQYLAYLHNAEDQLRGEAATMRFFSNGAYDNPMFLRIAGLAYQSGFGGHFHNDNSLAVLRDLPGVIILVPARGDDALELYRTAFALARTKRRVVVAIEPIALYHQRDLFEPGDGAWLATDSGGAAKFQRARVYDEPAGDLVIATFGNGVYLSRRAARRLRAEHGIGARVLDLRWIAPLPIDDVFEQLRTVPRLLVVDECRQSGNLSEAMAAAVLERDPRVRFARVTSADSFIPLGAASELVLVSEQQIVDAAVSLLRRAG